MHSNTAVLLLALSAVTPTLSAPLSLGSLGKEVAKGLASGGALAGIVAGIDKLDGSSSTTISSKREFSEKDMALLKRAVSLGDLGKEIAQGLASGGALAGVTAAIDKLDGSTSSTTTSKREFSEDDIAVLKRAVSFGDLGKEVAQGLASGGALAGVTAAIDKLDGSSSTTTSKRAVSLGDLGKEVAQGLASGGALAGVTAAIDKLDGSGSTTSSKRESLSLGSLGKTILGTGASLVTSSVVGDVIDDVTGQSSKRETITLPPTLGFGLGPEILPADNALLNGESLTRREMEVRSLLGKIVDDADSVITKGIVGGVASAVGGSVVSDLVGSKRDSFILPPTITPVLTPAEIAAIEGKSSKRDIDIRSLLSKVLPAAEDTFEDILKKAVAGGVGSAVGGAAVSSAVGDKSSKRGLTKEQLLAALLTKESSKRSLNDLD